MAFHKTTPEALGRADEFYHFTEEVPCSFSFCADIDVTALYGRVKREGVRFFPAFLHCLAAEVNARREFRMHENAAGELGWFDSTNPCYTVFHEAQKRFTDVWTEYDEDFSVFYERYLHDRKEYGGREMKPSKPYEGENLFNVSCIPWASFTGFGLNVPKSTRFFSPIFTVGKYYLREGKLYMPFAAQVHHAVCDGWHVAAFVNGLQERMNDFLKK